jgi:hypothetical protein
LITKLTFKNYYLSHKKIPTCTKHQEVKIAAELAKILGCKTEVYCPFDLGRIDLLSKNWLIECKYSSSTANKQALGQLLVYSEAMNFKANLGLGLIGNLPGPGIIRFCQRKTISVFFYNLHTCEWSITLDLQNYV